MKVVKRFFLSIVCLVSIFSNAYAEDLAPININTASVEELQQMKGVGQTRAEAIVAYREQNGAFEQVEDLLEVNGIGDATLARNRDMLAVD
ncbi:MAG: ComEA family DNA-binding protein [Legionellales bacterium]|jgi:competence protein ComEA